MTRTRTSFPGFLAATAALVALLAPPPAAPAPRPAPPVPAADASVPALDGWSTEAQALFRGLVAAKAAGIAAGQPRPVAAFDCDNTLIDGDISYATLVLQAREARYAFPAGSAGPLDAEGARLLADVRAGHERKDARASEARVAAAYRGYHERWESGRNLEACGYLAALLEGMTPVEAGALGRDALAKAEAHPRCLLGLPSPPGHAPLAVEQGIRIRRPMRALVDLLQAAGWEVFVVSASARPVVEAVAARYGIPADHVLGVQTAERDGRLTGRVLPPVTWRQGKVDALLARTGRRPTLALGDAWTDFEMLASAEAAVLVDRGKADLRQAVRARGVVVQPRFEGPEAVLPPCAP